MFSHASDAPVLTTLSNTQLLMYVEFMAAANNRIQPKDEVAADGTNTSGE